MLAVFQPFKTNLMLPLLEQPCCCCGGGAAALTGEADDVSIHCAGAGVVVEGVGTDGGGPTDENIDGGAVDDEGALQPGEICSALRMRSGCCRSLKKIILSYNILEKVCSG